MAPPVSLSEAAVQVADAFLQEGASRVRLKWPPKQRAIGAGLNIVVREVPDAEEVYRRRRQAAEQAGVQIDAPKERELRKDAERIAADMADEALADAEEQLNNIVNARIEKAIAAKQERLNRSLTPDEENYIVDREVQAIEKERAAPDESIADATIRNVVARRGESDAAAASELRELKSRLALLDSAEREREKLRRLAQRVGTVADLTREFERLDARVQELAEQQGLHERATREERQRLADAEGIGAPESELKKLRADLARAVAQSRLLYPVIKASMPEAERNEISDLIARHGEVKRHRLALIGAQDAVSKAAARTQGIDRAVLTARIGEIEGTQAGQGEIDRLAKAAGVKAERDFRAADAAAARQERDAARRAVDQRELEDWEAERKAGRAPEPPPSVKRMLDAEDAANRAEAALGDANRALELAHEPARSTKAPAELTPRVKKRVRRSRHDRRDKAELEAAEMYDALLPFVLGSSDFEGRLQRAESALAAAKAANSPQAEAEAGRRIRVIEDEIRATEDWLAKETLRRVREKHGLDDPGAKLASPTLSGGLTSVPLGPPPGRGPEAQASGNVPMRPADEADAPLKAEIRDLERRLAAFENLERDVRSRLRQAGLVDRSGRVHTMPLIPADPAAPDPSDEAAVKDYEAALRDIADKKKEAARLAPHAGLLGDWEKARAATQRTSQQLALARRDARIAGSTPPDELAIQHQAAPLRRRAGELRREIGELVPDWNGTDFQALPAAVDERAKELSRINAELLGLDAALGDMRASRLKGKARKTAERKLDAGPVAGDLADYMVRAMGLGRRKRGNWVSSDAMGLDLPVVRVGALPKGPEGHELKAPRIEIGRIEAGAPARELPTPDPAQPTRIAPARDVPIRYDYDKYGTSEDPGPHPWVPSHSGRPSGEGWLAFVRDHVDPVSGTVLDLAPRDGAPPEDLPDGSPNPDFDPERDLVPVERAISAPPSHDVFMQARMQAQINLAGLRLERGKAEEKLAAATTLAEKEASQAKLKRIDEGIQRENEIYGALEQPGVFEAYLDWREQKAMDAAGGRSSFGQESEESQAALDHLRDVFFGENAPVGTRVNGVVRGEGALVGMPTGQAVAGFERGKDSGLPQGLDTGPRKRPKVSRKRGHKAGDKAEAGEAYVGDVNKDALARPRPLQPVIGTEHVPPQEVPNLLNDQLRTVERQLADADPDSEEAAKLRKTAGELMSQIQLEPLPLDAPGHATGQLVLRDADGLPVAVADVPMVQDAQGRLVPASRTVIDAAVKTAGKVLDAESGSQQVTADLDVHLIPDAAGGWEIQAAPVGTVGIEAIRAERPRDMPVTQARISARRVPSGRRRGQAAIQSREETLGAALAKARTMVAQQGRRQGVERTARVFLHSDVAGSPRPVHFRDISGAGTGSGGKKRTGSIHPAGSLTQPRWPKGTPWHPLGTGPGRFRAMGARLRKTARKLTEADFTEGFAQRLMGVAKARIRQAHSRFQMESLRRLYPDLAGTLLDRKYEEERSRDEEFLTRMESRIRLKVEAAFNDPNLTPAEKARKARTALSLEQHYFKRHLSEAAWRMARTAEMIRLKEAGEPGAYWLMDSGLQSHTADCLAMESRVWPWSVLDVVNPANRHPGCGCKLIAEGMARQLGLPVKRGYRGASWQGAVGEPIQEGVIRVPLPPGTRGGNELHDTDTGRFVSRTVLGGIPASLERPFKLLTDAAERGDRRQARIEAERLRSQIEELPAAQRPSALLAAASVLAASDNPTGGRVATGVAARAPIAKADNAGGWANGSHAWAVPRGVLSPATRQGLARVKDPELKITDAPGGELLIEHPKMRRARDLEITLPQLRTFRVNGDGEPLEDERPLDLADDENQVDLQSGYRRTNYRNVDNRQLGDSGEMLIDAVMDRMEELGYLVPGDTRKEFLSEGGGHNELDWIINGYAVEVKSASYRGLVPGTTREGQGISRSETLRKQEALDEMNRLRAQDGEAPLKPMLVQVIVDLDRDQGHVFVHEYPPGKGAFKSRRLPRELSEKLLDGTLKPGKGGHPERGEARGPTVFVGSFPLVYNPLKTSHLPGTHLSSTRSQSLRAKAEGRPPQDKGVQDIPAELDAQRPPPVSQERGTSRKQAKRSRNAEIVAKALANLEQHGDMRQIELARIFGVNQSNISRVLSRSPEVQARKKELRDAKLAAQKPTVPVKPADAPKPRQSGSKLQDATTEELRNRKRTILRAAGRLPESEWVAQPDDFRIKAAGDLRLGAAKEGQLVIVPEKGPGVVTKTIHEEEIPATVTHPARSLDVVGVKLNSGEEITVPGGLKKAERIDTHIVRTFTVKGEAGDRTEKQRIKEVAPGKWQVFEGDTPSSEAFSSLRHAQAHADHLASTAPGRPELSAPDATSLRLIDAELEYRNIDPRTMLPRRGRPKGEAPRREKTAADVSGRDLAVAKDYAAGMSVAEIIRAHGLKDRFELHRILKGLPPDVRPEPRARGRQPRRRQSLLEMGFSEAQADLIAESDEWLSETESDEWLAEVTALMSGGDLAAAESLLMGVA